MRLFFCAFHSDGVLCTVFLAHSEQMNIFLPSSVEHYLRTFSSLSLSIFPLVVSFLSLFLTALLSCFATSNLCGI